MQVEAQPLTSSPSSPASSSWPEAYAFACENLRLPGGWLSRACPSSKPRSCCGSSKVGHRQPGCPRARSVPALQTAAPPSLPSPLARKCCGVYRWAGTAYPPGRVPR
eukprot:256989-Chlamydomonas_euryale.AAC.1